MILLKNLMVSRVYLDGGSTDIGLESTVIKVDEENINILRPGKITKEQLKTVANQVKVDKNVLGQVKRMKLFHHLE